MILNKPKGKISVSEVLALLLSALYAVGVRRWFPVCPPMSETVMACHWAGETLKALSILLSALLAVHLIIPDLKVKMGMDLALMGVAALTLFVPGRIIPICAGEQMACRSLTEPWTLALCGVLLGLLLIDLIILAAALSREKHRRKDSQ